MSEDAGKPPVGATEGCWTTPVLLVVSVSVSVSAGVSEVATGEGEADVVGCTISESGGRTPVAAAEDC